VLDIFVIFFVDPQVELRSAPFRRCELSEARIELNWIECS
jgi:hypothetical protein